DDANFRQMPAQRIERLRALADQQLARAVAHQLRLIVDRTHRHKTHVRTPQRLADRRGVGGVVLVAADEGLHIGGGETNLPKNKTPPSPPPQLRPTPNL